MMSLAPGQRPGAAGEHTAPVANGQGGALGDLDDPAGPAHLQRLGGRTPEDRGQQGHRRPQPGRQAPGATGTVGVVVVVGGVAGDQHPGHRAITGQPLARLRVQRPPPTDLATNSVVAAEEAVQVHGDSQLGPDPTGLGEPAPFQGVAGQLGQGVSVALAAAAAVVGVGWAGQGLQGRQEGLAGLGLQQPIHCHHPLEGRRKP